MDLHDGLGDGGAQGEGEPPGFGSEHGAPAAEGGTPDAGGHDGSAGYEDGSADPRAGSSAGTGRAGGSGAMIGGAGTPGTTGGAGGPEPTEGAGGPEPTGGAGSPEPTGGAHGLGGPTAAGTMIVEVDGETRELPAEKDYTGDGRPDAAAETADGRVIVFADTEDNETGAAGPDGRADEAYVVDKQTGRVVAAAHIDPRTGAWIEDVDTEGSTATDPGTGGTGGTGTDGTGGAGPAASGPDSTAGGPGSTAGAPDSTARGSEPGGAGNPGGTPAGTGSSRALAGSGTMIVDMDGETRELPAEKDYTGDGRPDAAAETADGRVIVFADTEDNETGAAGPDGRADEAYVVDKQTGRVVAAAHIDPRTGAWVEDAGGGTGSSPTGGGVGS